ALGAPIVDMQRGRRARLTTLGERLLEADTHVRSTLEGQFEKLRGEVRAMLGAAIPGRQPRLLLRASHDLALPELARLCAPQVRLEIAFRGADECLASLARGECDLAGFHVADALPRAAAAAAALGRWLDPRKHQLIHFVAREQGIIVRPGVRIRSVHDLARPGVRFINRPPGAGTHDDLDLAIAAAVSGGRADAGFGLRAAAARYALEFVPLATERYYLAAARQSLREAPMQWLVGVLRSRPFGECVARLPGYDASRAGARDTLGAALGWLVRPGAKKRTG
ncbi:MAG: substrate-binding domain-containing protein, partial [Burkholderiales bacterium]